MRSGVCEGHTCLKNSAGHHSDLQDSPDAPPKRVGWVGKKIFSPMLENTRSPIIHIHAWHRKIFFKTLTETHAKKTHIKTVVETYCRKL